MHEIEYDPEKTPHAAVELSVGWMPTILAEGTPWIAFKTAVERVGLSYPAQYRKLKGRSAATVAQMAMVAQDGKRRVMDVVDVPDQVMARKFLAYLDARSGSSDV